MSFFIMRGESYYVKCDRDKITWSNSREDAHRFMYRSVAQSSLTNDRRFADCTVTDAKGVEA